MYDDTRNLVVSIEITNVTEYLAGANDSFEGCFNDTDPPAKPSTVGKQLMYYSSILQTIYIDFTL